MRYIRKKHSANSNPSGFGYVWIHHKSRREAVIISEQTENYNAESYDNLIKAYSEKKIAFVSKIIFAILFGAAMATTYFFSKIVWEWSHSWNMAVGCFIGWMLLFLGNIKTLVPFAIEIYLSYFLKPMSHSIKQWHAAEHKTMTLLEKDLPLTMENLRKMEIFRSSCGSQYFCYAFSLYLSLLISLLLFCFLFLISPSFTVIVFLFFFWFNLFFSYNLFYFLQTKFFTAEPTDEQLKEALESAKRLKSKLESALCE